MSDLPADIATQLKPDAAVEKMEPPEIVARTRTKLSSRANISNVWCHCHKFRPKVPQCYTCYGYGHVSKECPMEREAKNYASSKTIRCYVCNTVGHKVKITLLS